MLEADDAREILQLVNKGALFHTHYNDDQTLRGLDEDYLWSVMLSQIGPGPEFVFHTVTQYMEMLRIAEKLPPSLRKYLQAGIEPTTFGEENPRDNREYGRAL